jgi:putative oxygen-independent coproporphyrinogen III oxidase
MTPDHDTAQPASPGGFGVYIHVPFCSHRCDYCSFAAWDDRSELMDRYVTSLGRELAMVASALPEPATSVFVGGGTPSLLAGSDMAALLGHVPLADGAEVTVEVNPEDACDELFDHYLSAGVNRVSFGVQSMASHVLVSLGRRHDPQTVPAAVAAARRAGFTSFNLDLIYGAVGESVDDWRRTLDLALALEPPHVSAYALTVEAGTPLAADLPRHPDDDDQAIKYLMTDEAMTAAGMPWYEISNWARPGHACRHNQLYWAQGNYLGAGCSAHSHVNGRRWWNLRTPERYMAAIDSGTDHVAGSEELDDDARRVEGLQLMIRTAMGVPSGSLRPDDVTGVLDGLVARDGDRLVLTVAGRLLANEVALRLQ